MDCPRIRTLAAGFALAALCVMSGCGRSAGASAENTESPAGSPTQSAIVAAVSPTSATPSVPPPKPVDPMVVLHTTVGDITLQLFQEKAPRTVENFLRGYAERGFYDQTIFHHVEPETMIIGGGYTADLQRKSTRAPIYNESRNGLSNRRGTVAMIREPDAPHSATSEFFFNLADNADFDFHTSDEQDLPGYCVFGEVVGGMDVVQRIARLPTESRGDLTQMPSPAVVISSIERLR
jgi:peptidyl-prolyl cis-trans isomerase A (cyclophilin A)